MRVSWGRNRTFLQPHNILGFTIIATRLYIDFERDPVRKQSKQLLKKQQKKEAEEKKRLQKATAAVLPVAGVPNKKRKVTSPIAKAAAVKAGSELERIMKPCVQHEASRKQHLVRTGFKGPGQSIQFKYGPDETYPNKAASLKAASKELAKHMAVYNQELER